MTAPDVLPPAASPPGLLRDAGAGLLTVLGCVLLGAPVGLLWAAVTPRVEVVIAAGGELRLTDPAGQEFIAADGWFLGLVLLAGLVCGLLAWALGRRHGPGVVLGLVVGGLLAAEVARRSGELVDAELARAAVEAGRAGAVDLAVQLRSEQARLGWPVAALAAHLVLTLFQRERAA